MSSRLAFIWMALLVSLSASAAERVEALAFARDARALMRQRYCGNAPISECVDRLRVELHDALGTPFAKDGAGRPSHAAELVVALFELGPAASTAAPELLEAADSRDPRAVAEALRALAAMKRGEVVPRLRQQLRAGVLEPSLVALESMGPLARAAVPELVALADTPDWAERPRIARLLGQASGADAVDALRTLLVHPPFLAQEEAAEALGNLGPAASPAVDALTQLAATHWLWTVRAKAAAAATRISGAAVQPRPPSCSLRLSKIEDHWVGVLRGEPLRLSVVERSYPDPACRGVTANATAASLSMTGGCLVAEAKGDLGERVEWLPGPRRPSTPREVAVSDRQLLFERTDLSPVQWVRGSDTEVWLIEGFGVLGGGVTHLHLADGRWRSEPVVRFPGEAQAIALGPRGTLLLLTTERDAQSACPDARQQRFSVGYLLRVSADGTVESLP